MSSCAPLGVLRSAVVTGVRSTLVTVEVHRGDGIPLETIVGLPGSAAQDTDDARETVPSEPGVDLAPASAELTSTDTDQTETETETETETTPAEAPAPAKPLFRPGTKQARLVEMISAPDGAGIDAPSETLGWQVHTTRAALTGLRKKGLAVESAKGADGKAVYRIAGEEVGSDAA